MNDRTTIDPALMSEFADTVVWRALLMMQDEGVPFDMMMDRILTAAAAHLAANDGAERTAQFFRTMADNIDAGALSKMKITPDQPLQ